MRLKGSLIAVVLVVSACSQSGPAQTPGQSEKPAAPPGAAPASPAAAPAESLKPEKDGTAQKPSPADPSPATSAAQATAPPPSEPRFREVTIPAGTPLQVRLTTALASDTSRVEDAVRGALAERVAVNGVTVVPAGAEIAGTVYDAKRSGRVKGRASIAFRFERLTVRDESLAIRTALVSREAAANRKEDVKKGAIGAGAGAIVGGLVGGGKGAAIGAGIGGTGAVVATRGEEVRLAAGTIVRTTLQQPLAVLVPRPSGS